MPVPDPARFFLPVLTDLFLLRARPWHILSMQTELLLKIHRQQCHICLFLSKSQRAQRTGHGKHRQERNDQLGDTDIPVGGFVVHMCQCQNGDLAALGNTQSLCGNAQAAGIESAQGIAEALAFSADHAAGGDDGVFDIDLSDLGGADAALVLDMTDADTGGLLEVDKESSEALGTLGQVCVGISMQ